jgi:hypothetical protein
MLAVKTHIRTIEGCLPSAIPEQILNSTEPVVLKGLVANWPLVKAGLESINAADNYIRQFYSGEPVTAYSGEPDIKGRIFYNSDLTGFNYESANVKLDAILDKILHHLNNDFPPTFYVGSTLIDNWFPGLRVDNDIAVGDYTPLASIWIGNRSRIPAHYDFPDNIACCAVGRRRFTLFPPEQLSNLYVGPLDLTPAGQSISLVDFHNPDYERYPLFHKAVEAAQVAELDAGDALFIPSMWWHHVESLESYNVLVNYWWRRTPGYLGSPMNVLTHALLSLRSLPKAQRQAWQDIFDYYIFKGEENTLTHIPEKSLGNLSPMNDTLARKLRAELLSKLNR